MEKNSNTILSELMENIIIKEVLLKDWCYVRNLFMTDDLHKLVLSK